MTLLSWWALAGLLLIAPLVVAHLRGRPRVEEVASLLIWQQMQGLGAGAERRLRLPRLPLLLALQALALALLVVALARPAAGAPHAAGARQILVLDDSLWMSAPGRLLDGERELDEIAGKSPGAGPVTVVLASETPHVIYRGPQGGLSRALRAIRPSTAGEELTGALSLAGALLAPGGHIALARAPEDALPRLLIRGGELQTVSAGAPKGFQAITSMTARCGIGGGSGCEVLATVQNSGSRPASDGYRVEGLGASTATGTVNVPANGAAQIALAATPDTRVTVTLLGGGAILRGASQAGVTVPGPDGIPSPTRVTLVGEPADAIALARALHAVAGVRLRLRTPADYRQSEAAANDVVVVDGRLPGGRLPDAAGVLLVDPTRLPGGHVGGSMIESELSGSDPSSPVLEGVDLSSLAVDGGGARTLELPAALRWVAWSPEGPLIAYGREDGRRVGVLSFDPGRSDLPQLPAFPLLVANLLRELTGSSPPPTVSSPSNAAVDLAPAAPVAGGSRRSLAPWLLCAALMVMLFEAAYASRRRSAELPA